MFSQVNFYRGSRLVWLLALLMALMAVPRLSGAASPGTSGGTILSIPTGARAIAMGEAYTAAADDANSLYWNPAGLAFLNQSQAAFLYNQFFDDLTYNNVSVATPLEYGGVGASVSYLSYGQIDAFDPNGASAGSVNANSAVATLGGGVLGNNWAAGANIKGIQERLADTKANGFAGDVGVSVLYPKTVAGGTLRAAFTLRNLGTGITYLDQTDPFPRQWRIGVAALQMLDRKFNVAMDYGQERDQNGAIYAGAEYWPMKYIALRTGYSGNDLEGTGLRAGLGLKWKDLSFDYAFSDYGALGAAHRYELSLRFGAIQPRLSPEERELLRRGKIAMAQGRYGEATMLFDSLIQLVPNYRPVRRLVKTAMAGYERTSKETATPLVRNQSSHGVLSPYEADELKYMESLLNLTEQAQDAQAPKSPIQEKRQ